MTQGRLRLDDPVTCVRGIGEAKALQLERLNVRTVEDLVYFFPRRYEDRRQVVPLAALVPGGPPQAFRARVVSVENRVTRTRKLNLIRVCLSDGNSVVWALWFNRWNLKNLFKTGVELALYGSLEPGRSSPELLNPEFEILDSGDPKSVGRIVPVYPLTAGLNEKWLRRVIESALDETTEEFPEVIDIMAGLGFAEIANGAIRQSMGRVTTIPMGAKVDYKGTLSHIDIEDQLVSSKRMTKEAQANRQLLREAMAAGGFKVLRTEWWHFNLCTRAEAEKYYKVIR